MAPFPLGGLQAGLADQSLGELSRKMVELGVEAGFDISGADLRDIYRAMVDEAGVSRELADEELSAVSGGVQIFDWFIKSFEGLQVDRSRG
ncbi:MAG: hypothetical protein GX548_03175 [Lentisphaerae bacterium]|nr:hypothetical protein [Lentisphaerota bacterium]